MIGRNWRAPIGLILALNSSFGRNRAFSIITLVSIATSVALATSLEISSRAVQERAGQTADVLAGSAKLEIVGGTLGISEELVNVAATVPGVAVASATINAVLHTLDGRLPIHVIGMDLLSGASVRDFEATAGGIRIRDPLRLLARSDAVVISSALAARLGVDLGDTVHLRSHLGPVNLRIEGILAEHGLASAFGNQVAVMDVFALQALLGRQGSVDQIDVVPVPNVSLDSLEADISRVIAGAATVRRVGLRQTLADRVLAAVRRVVVMIAAIGALAAGLASYSAMSGSVERRLPEFSLLRSTGWSATSIWTWIVLETTGLSIAGTVVGCFAGTILGRRLVPVMARTTDYFAENVIDLDGVGLGRATLGIALAVGGAAALLGTVAPARLATRRWAFDPTPNTIAGGGPSPSSVRRKITLWILSLLIVVLVLQFGSAVIKIAGSLAVGTYLAWVVTRGAIARLDSIRPLLSRLIPHVGHLIGTGLQTRARGTALSVATIAGLVAFVCSIITLSSSFSTTIVRVVNSRFAGGILITAGPMLEGPGREPFSAETVAAIASAPQVTGISPAANHTTLFKGEEVDLIGVATGTAIDRGAIDLTEGEANDVKVRVESGAVIVSDAFVRKFGISTGDSIQLQTPKGPRDFPIAGTARALAGPGGVIYADTQTVEQIWGRTGATSILVWTSSSPQEAAESIAERVNGPQTLFFMYGDDLRRQALRLAGRFDSMIVAVASLAALLSAIAIANLLIGLVAERRLEFSLLRAAGAGPSHLAILVLCDAVLVMLAGIALGALLGFFVSFPVLELLRDDFGLSVERRSDFGRLGLLASVLCGTALLSALYPAALAHRPVSAEVLAID